MSTSPPGLVRARQRNPRGQGGHLREELIAAAVTLMAAAGSHGHLSARAVTRQAGVSPQSFYLHFSSLDDLLWEVYAREYDALTAKLTAAASGVADDRRRLMAICLAYCEFANERPASYRLMFTQRDELDRAWEGRFPGQSAWDLLRACVAACTASDAAYTPGRVATLVWAGLHGLVTLRNDRPGFPWAPMPELVKQLLDGLVLSGQMRPGP
jgi:AcrR family transcriptional regulator